MAYHFALKRLGIGFLLSFASYWHLECMDGVCSDLQLSKGTLIPNKEQMQRAFSEELTALMSSCNPFPLELVHIIMRNYLELALVKRNKDYYYCESTESVSVSDQDIQEKEKVFYRDSYTSTDIGQWERLKPYICYSIEARKDLIEVVLYESLRMCNQQCSLIHGAACIIFLPQVVTYLDAYCKNGFDKEILNKCVFGKTPLVAAIECGSLEAVDLFLSKEVQLQAQVSKRGPFFTAVKSFNASIIKRFLMCGAAHGISVNEKTRKRKNTLLHMAIDSRNLSLLSPLLIYGADITGTNARGETPLLYAVILSKLPPSKVGGL